MTPQERAASMQQMLMLAKGIAEKVDPVVPMDLIAAIMHIESDFNPTLVNMSPRARKRGGAWGVGQVTLATAKDYAERFKKDGAELWPRWDGTGESLKDPETNIGFMVKHLSHSLRKFDGDWLKAGTAYHQGNGTIQKLSREHSDQWQAHLAPYGSRYADLLNEKRRRYQGKPQQETPLVPTAGVGALFDGTGSGGGGGADCPRPADAPPPTDDPNNA